MHSTFQILMEGRKGFGHMPIETYFRVSARRLVTPIKHIDRHNRGNKGIYRWHEPTATPLSTTISHLLHAFPIPSRKDSKSPDHSIPERSAVDVATIRFILCGRTCRGCGAWRLLAILKRSAYHACKEGHSRKTCKLCHFQHKQKEKRTKSTQPGGLPRNCMI